MSELTTDHVEPMDGGLVVDAPSGTSEIRIERTFLRDRLGAWGADHAFTLTNGRVVADAATVTFTSFRANGTPTYTLGAHESIRFAERPMWLSVDQDGDGGPITVTADAEDTTGQPVRVDAEWLWAQGIVAPQAVHEDGSRIPVAWVDGGFAYRFDVPHFSDFTVCPGLESELVTTSCPDRYTDVSEELDVKVRVNGVVSDHEGEAFWDGGNRTLQIGVDDYPSTVEVLVERAWVDDRIGHLAVWERTVTEETVDGTAYYVSLFPAEATPAAHVLREYQASDKWMWTQGNLSTVTTFGRPAFVQVTSPASDRLNVTTAPAHVNDTTLPYSIGVNLTFLSELGIESPEVYDGDNETVGSLAIGSGLFQAVVDPQQSNPTGEQTIEWEIHNAQEAWLNSSHDLSHVDKLSDATRDNDAYQVTDWEPGWTGLRADAEDDTTKFNTTVDLTTVDWEAPEPILDEATLGCEGVDEYVVVQALEMDSDAPDTDAPWITWQLVDSHGLESDTLSSQGNLSIGEVGDWDSMAQGWANDTTTDATFVENTCGGFETVDLKSLLEYEYESTMTVDSEGDDPYRGTDVAGSDADTLVVVFKKVPHGPL